MVESQLNWYCVSRLTSAFVVLVSLVKRFAFRVSCFVFRVSRFTGICGNLFLGTRMRFSFHFGILTMIRSYARWCARLLCKMVAMQDGVQYGVQDVMQDSWSA